MRRRSAAARPRRGPSAGAEAKRAAGALRGPLRPAGEGGGRPCCGGIGRAVSRRPCSTSASFVLELPFVGAMWWLGEGRGAGLLPSHAVKWKEVLTRFASYPAFSPSFSLFNGRSCFLFGGVGWFKLCEDCMAHRRRRSCKCEHVLCNAYKNNPDFGS